MAVACLVAGSVSLWAQTTAISAGDEERISAGIIIAIHDDLSAQCEKAGGFTQAQRTELLAWRTDNQIDRLRAHLNGPGLSPELREKVKAGAAQVVQKTAATAPPCTAALSITRTPYARFEEKLPRMLAGATQKEPPPSKPLEAAAPAPLARSAEKIAADIEGFGFDSCTRVGYGGMVMFVPCPVVLFRNGSALTDVEGLNHPRGLAAHRAANPGDWTRWQRAGDRIQLRKSKGWENITYTAVYSALPRNFRLDGRYRFTGGTGNTAMGGGQAVIAWFDYVFTPDGRVRRDGGAGSSTSGTGVSVTTASSAAAKTGRYRVEGLILAIDYDDGSKERRVIIADPKDAGKGTMWLDGEGYVYKK